ncbi:type III-B CRISPR module RAMP protein Cmr6 [Rhodoferax sp.]|uniref:type III-B CRISPR module RAMP protein Cmr6 n=1 Tax=Rhodoferax sp. TaxID=50421 RepID=UPI0027193EFB|nr:type III-B CRISPR module RAMP protein Cmr6 [Rhodoferax sp.]MDO8320511.1 type III-B CRISPR module RAMP protein Cmr6 [Rhodoferax sp.]
MTLPRRIAALPNYLASGSNTVFSEAAPGHKFLGYFRNFQDVDARAFEPYKGKAKLVAPLPPPGPQNRTEQAQLKAEYDGVLNEVCKLPAASCAQVSALRNRQQALIAHYGANAYRISTTSTAPFATGLGNEHPIENGFAFLTPYGLPYLAGSGVKGILRRAMQELRDEDEGGFTDTAINALFGPENINQPEDAQRGALDFWDVFPDPAKAGNKLVVEIMTPHFGGYYQKSETPHDSGAPIPVSFLAVPAKSQFDFHVVCQPNRLPAALQDQWRSLLDRAFAHAFEWVGFGAKTSVGYGAMAAARPTPPPATTTATGSAAPSSAAADTQIWPTAKLQFNPSSGIITASFEGKTAVGAKGAEADQLRAALGEERVTKLKKAKELNGVAVMVVKLGNTWQLKSLCQM